MPTKMDQRWRLNNIFQLFTIFSRRPQSATGHTTWLGPASAMRHSDTRLWWKAAGKGKQKTTQHLPSLSISYDIYIVRYYLLEYLLLGVSQLNDNSAVLLPWTMIKSSANQINQILNLQTSAGLRTKRSNTKNFVNLLTHPGFHDRLIK